MTVRLPERAKVEWRADPGFGVYVHVPFCRHRCHYCDFNTYEGLEDLYAPYVDALVDEILRWPGDLHPQPWETAASGNDSGSRNAKGRLATTVFIGGGTPTLLSATQLARILEAISQRIGVSSDAEVTVEANPETVDATSFAALLEAGFNRFSIGVQSLSPKVLEGLGRTHSAQRALQALADGRRAGADNINLDLIYGSVWERTRDWEETLRRVIEAGPEHVSAYALTIEEGTPLATLIATGRIPDVDPDLQAERYEIARRMLGSAGYRHYEISNFARRARASRHNLLYWSAGNYLAFGAGAHGHLDGTRWWNVKLPREYIAKAADDPIAGSEHLDEPERAREALMLGLRLRSGVDLAAFETRFGSSLRPLLDERIPQLQAAGLLEVQAGKLRIPDSRVLVTNDVLCRLLA